jgi:DNA-binding NtrC family response regulator
VVHRPTVLVVDDDESILAAFRDFLRKEHCMMISARSAEGALQKLKSEGIDLLITDVRLEYQSGVTLFMKAKTERPNLPVIVITGYVDVLRDHEVKAYGADYLFLKPLELDKLREAVRKCLHLVDDDISRANKGLS